MPKKEKDYYYLLQALENFLEQKRVNNKYKPNIILKEDLESFLAREIQASNITFEKKCNRINSKYRFYFKNTVVLLEFYYRYGNYYTRHSVEVQELSAE